MKSLIKSKYSYLFVSYIPKDLSNHFGGRNKFRVSLKSVQFCKQIHNLSCLYYTDIPGKLIVYKRFHNNFSRIWFRDMEGFRGRFYFEGSEYGFKYWRTNKLTVNIDGLFYITLTLSWISPSPHLSKLVSTNTGEISYPTHFLPLSNETLAVVPLPRNGSRIVSPSFEVPRMNGLISFSGNVAECSRLLSGTNLLNLNIKLIFNISLWFH